VLLRQGIEPDFVLSVDPQLLNARHFDFCESPRSILVSESCIYPSIFQRRWRFCALFHSNFPLMARLENPPFAPIRSGGSVATAAWDFARNCGASALYVAGLDLSYPTLRSHCLGTMPQRQTLAGSGRLAPIEHLNWRVTVSAGARQVDSWKGDRVLSDKRMNVYRTWLEDSLKNISDWPNYVIDGAEGRAARIEGMKLIRLEQALEEPLRREEIDARLEQILAEQPSSLRFAQGLLEAAGTLLAEVYDIYRWSAELIALLCYSRRSSSQEKRLRRLHEKISQSPSCNIISFSFTDDLSRMVGRSPEQEESGQATKDRLQIYQRFYLSSKFHLYWLEMAVSQLSKNIKN
ncbi:MAG: 6-hydroxymethylpterin diphosphokinase MptE-like protein, partial [Spirochaetota bacterium]